MCGIITIAGNNIQKIQDVQVHAMLSSLAKRGPDEQDFKKIGNVILGQTRLSIVDLAGGHQPMHDNKFPFTVVFNGEIYGYKDIRKDLESRGHIFSNNSDTEVILKAYAEYGYKCVDHLDGMFAFTLWDESKKELFIARDRFGKKPLYYAFDPHTNLVIASEIKAIFETGIKGVVDPSAIDNYLTLMYIPPWKTVYKNIYTLPPASYGIYKDNKLDIKSYWKLTSKHITPTYVEAKDEVTKLLKKAVEKRMVADVEIGSLLSGGADSTLITAYAQEFSKTPIKTFSIGYENYINELPYAKQASEKIGTEHYTLQAKGDFIHELEKIIGYMDEPHADSSNLAQHIVSELASTKVKVVLSGDGADELFLGYGWYWKYWNTNKVTRLKNTLFSNPFAEYLKNITIFTHSERCNLWNDKSVVNENILAESVLETKLSGIEKISLFDITTYLPGQLLSKVDRTSMLNSLEVRCPFLDHKLAEYVYSLPLSFKTDKKSGKKILKDILLEIMPETFVYRRKQGFGAPVKAWLKTEKMRSFVYQHLTDKAVIFDYFKKEIIEDLLTSFYINKKESVYYKIWVLLCLELWFQSHKKNHA